MTAAAVAAAALVTAAMTGCSALSGSASTGGGNSITLYSGQHPQTTQKLVAAFEKQTGIKVSVRSDDEDVLAAQIVTEGKRSPADVFYTENTPPLEFLQGKGLLSALRSSTLAATPSRYNSAQGDWVGVSARVSVLIYNPRLISKSQLPTSVMQLADPKYQGKLALAAGETDFQPIVTSILRAHGPAATETWLTAREGERGRPPLPGQRDRDQRREPRKRRAGHHQPVLLVPAAGRDRRRGHALEDRVLRPARSRLRARRLGRRGAEVQLSTRPPRSVSWPSWSASRPRRSSAATHSVTSTR